MFGVLKSCLFRNGPKQDKDAQVSLANGELRCLLFKEATIKDEWANDAPGVRPALQVDVLTKHARMR